jgi:hypothetical protein
MSEKTKFRLLILDWAIITIVISVVLGIGSRKLGNHLPHILSLYTGDTMWALAFFALFRALLPRFNLFSIFLVTLDFSFLIELSQFWHPYWLDGTRTTLIGGLLLGFGYKWTDLVCYTFGCLFGWLIFYLLERHLKH